MESPCFLTKASPQDSMTSLTAVTAEGYRVSEWDPAPSLLLCVKLCSSSLVSNLRILNFIGKYILPLSFLETCLLTFILYLCQSQGKRESGHEGLERGKHMRANGSGRAGSHILWLLGKSQSHSILLKSGPSLGVPRAHMDQQHGCFPD